MIARFKHCGILLGISILIASLLLTGCAGAFGLKAENLILPLANQDDISALSENNKAYFEANHAQLERIALYLAANEKAFGTRPIPLGLNNMPLIERVPDAGIRQEIVDLLKKGDILAIYAGLDGDADVRYIMAALAENDYSQGINYIKPGAGSGFDGTRTDQSDYNQIRRYQLLADNWYEFIYARADIRNADLYRQSAWDYLREKDGQKSVTGDWQKAAVTLVDWEGVGIKADQKDRDFVVGVQFHHELEALLGVIIIYLDPVTRKYVGTEPMM